MTLSNSADALMLIDLRKARTRFRKDTLHLLGDPSRVLLLIHPEKKLVAIRAVDRERSGDHSYKIRKNVFTSDFCFEIYSTSLVLKLRLLAGGLEAGSYRMSGRVLPSERAAVFYLSSISRFNSQEHMNE